MKQKIFEPNKLLIKINLSIAFSMNIIIIFFKFIKNHNYHNKLWIKFRILHPFFLSITEPIIHEAG